MSRAELIERLQTEVDQFDKEVAANPVLYDDKEPPLYVLFKECIKALLDDEARAALHAYVTAQTRMLEWWSGADRNLRRELWTNLHNCEHAARDALHFRDRPEDEKTEASTES